MRKVWSDIEPKLLTALKDTIPSESGHGRSRRYDPKDLMSWWNNAQVRLATMVPKSSFLILRGVDGLVVELPDDFYRPKHLRVSGYPEPLPRINIESAFLNNESFGYYVHEEVIVLCGLVLQGALVKLLYESYYAEVEHNDSEITIPRWAHEACQLYVVIQAAQVEAMSDARYRKFTTPSDAGGNPSHNPFLPLIKMLEGRFMDIISSHSDDDEDS